MIKSLYIAITNDKYELPLAIGGTRQELAEKLNISTDNVYYQCKLNRVSKKKFNNEHYRIVKIEDKE